VPIGLPEAEATLPAFVGVRNEAEQARRQAAAARQEKDEEVSARPAVAKEEKCSSGLTGRRMFASPGKPSTATLGHGKENM
jgi:hypothetical protein